MGARRRLIVALVLAVVGTAGWQGFSWYRDMKRAGTERLVNQLWIERMPRDARDQVRFLNVIEQEGHRVGGVGRGSRWRVNLDGFVWALDGDELRTRFPQDDVRARFKVRTWRCRGDVPAPFDWCLAIASGQRTWTFYSRDAWRIRPHESVLDEPSDRAAIGWLDQLLAVSAAAPAPDATADPIGAGPETAIPAVLQGE